MVRENRTSLGHLKVIKKYLTCCIINFKINYLEICKELPPIITIAYELTDTAAEELDKERNDLGEVELRKLKIQNLTCSYNYRTVGPDFLLVTSVLSNSDNIIPVRFKSNTIFVSNNSFEVFYLWVFFLNSCKSRD
jgi:hypothetical protein